MFTMGEDVIIIFIIIIFMHYLHTYFAALCLK